MLPRWRWASACGSSSLSAATNSRRVAVGASAGRWRQTRTMLEASALVSDPDQRFSLCAHRPGTADGKTGVDDCGQEGVPAGIGRSINSVTLRLLEGVVDGHREGRMRLVAESMHCLRHAVEEEGLGLLLAPMAVGRGDQLLGLWYCDRGEQVREKAATNGATRRRRSRKGQRIRCCRSRAGQWRRPCRCSLIGRQHRVARRGQVLH